MVVHTPTKLEVLRQTAAERRANNEEVPPSVIAAAATDLLAAEGQDAALLEGAVGGVDPANLDQVADDLLALDGARTDALDPARDREDGVVDANVTIRKVKTAPTLDLSLIHI